MKRLNVVGLIFIFYVFLISISFAATVQIPKTGQTTCYSTTGAVIACANTGQDGELQTGVAIPNPRFTVSGDCVTDNLTGLMWSKNTNVAGVAKLWQANLDYVTTLNAGAGLCGYHDWRMPNKNELTSISSAYLEPSVWLPSQGFTIPAETNYVSSTSRIWTGDTTCNHHDCYATGISWTGGYAGSNAGASGKSDTLAYLWITRTVSLTTSAPMKTGQTKCYNVGGSEIACANTGQDGEYQSGIAWMDDRFTDNGDETVTDKFTDLIWSKDTKTPGPTACTPNVTKSWQASLDHIKCLNTNQYLGYADWRMPNVNEMGYVFDIRYNTPALTSGHPFTNVQYTSTQSNLYWTSTTPAYNLIAVEYCDATFGNCGGGSAKTDTSIAVWPVRGPSSTYTLTTNTNGTGTGSISGGSAGTYIGGKILTLTATPDSDSTFTGWSGDCSGTSTCTLTMNANKTATATFALKQYTLTITKTGSGTVTVSPGTLIWSGNTGTVAYDAGTTLTLSTSTDASYNFTGWTGGSCSTGTCIFNITSDTSISALFTIKSFSISTVAGQNGTISCNPTTVNYGSSSTCTITPSSNYHLQSITDNNVDVLSSVSGSTYALSNVTADHEVKTTFEANPIPTYTITLSVGSNGSVLPSANQIVTSGSSTSFAITPSTGYQIANVTGCGGSLIGTTYTTGAITTDCTVAVTFSLIPVTPPITPPVEPPVVVSQYDLTVSIEGTGLGTVAINSGTLSCTDKICTSIVNSGTAIILTASPDNNSTLTSWTGCDTSSGNICTLTISSTKSISVTFAESVPEGPNMFTLTVSRSGIGSGELTIEGGGQLVQIDGDMQLEYEEGTELIITATPTVTSQFKSWSGPCTGSSSECTFTLTEDVILGAEFVLVQPSCTYKVSPTTRNVAVGAGTYSAITTTTPTCNWTVSSNDSWIKVVSKTDRKGKGTTNFNVSANTSTSSRTGTLTIADQTISVVQKGSSPKISISPTTLNFSRIKVGTKSKVKYITVRNVNFAPLTISSVSVDASIYEIQSNTCTSTLSRNSTCKIGVAFTPQVKPKATANLTIESDDPNPKKQKIVVLSGLGK